MEKGQRTLNGTSAVTENGINRSPGGPSILGDQTNHADGHHDVDGPTNLPTLSLMVDRTVDNNSPSRQGDVEMTG
jgi:hypothetical protein